MPTDVMRRPAAMGWDWQVARWTRVTPGRIGIALLAVVPLALFVPLGSFGFFSSWREGALILLSLSAVSLALGIGRDTAVPQPSEFWIAQKGISLADWAMNRWLLDVAFTFAVHVAWVIAWAIAAGVHGEAVGPRTIGSLTLWMLSLHFMITAILFAVGATGSQRGTEYCIGLLFVAAIEPVLTRFLPAALAIIVRIILPPVVPSINARVLLSTGEPLREALPSLLHAGAYTMVLLGLGAWLLSRRTPDEVS